MSKSKDHNNSEFDARRDVARGAGSVFLAKFGSIIEIVTLPAYTWMFGLATYGLYTVLWSLINLLENIADLAMTAALQRVLPKVNEAEARAVIIKGAFVLGVTPCLILAGILSWSSASIAPLFNVAEKDLVQLELAISLFVWALPLWATVEIATSALRACHAFGPEIRLRLLWEQLLRLVLAVVLWLVGVDTLALFIAHLGSLLVTAILALRVLNNYCNLKLIWKSKLSRSVNHDLFLSGLSVLPSNVLGRMFVDLPAVIINFCIPGAAGANAAGLYSIARKLASIPQLVRSVFSHVLSPIAASNTNSDHEAMQALYTFSIRISLLLAMPTAVAIIIAADSLLALFVTGAAAAWPILVILTAAKGIEAGIGPASAIQQVISHRGLPLINSAIGFIVATIVLFVAFPQYETLGVAFAVAAGQLTKAALSVLQLSRREKLHALDGSILRILGSVSIACLAIFIAEIVTSGTHIYFQGAVIFIVYLSVIWLSIRFALPRRDRIALGKFGRRLKLYS
ncbi:MAG: O-antigen/teichoic acid export membrane protein [Gammaproteobacteria bacterium]